MAAHDDGMRETTIRERQAADLDGCVAALRAVHDADAYPVNWPRDPHAWLAPPDLLHAWVAEGFGGSIAGHVAVRRPERPSLPAEVSRLFVVPAARRQSIGRALLDRVVAWAGEQGLALELNVTDGNRSAAVAFYEATGWRHTHTTPADWTGPGGAPIMLRYYLLRPG